MKYFKHTKNYKITFAYVLNSLTVFILQQVLVLSINLNDHVHTDKSHR